MLLAALLAANPPASPQPEERQLPTIITVISSPYCNSLADHFNGAMMPMLANDRVLDSVGVQLDDLNTLFYETNYVQQFLQVRDNVFRQEVTLNRSLPGIEANIKALRDGAAQTTDPKATAEVQQASWQLQTAYDHQRQMAIDLENLYHTMLDYNISRANPPMGGFSEREMTEAPAMRDSKEWLHYYPQRATIDKSEDQAVDTAYNAATTYCVPKK